MANMNKVKNMQAELWQDTLGKEASLTGPQCQSLTNTTFQRTFLLYKAAADAMASTTTTSEFFIYVPWDCRLISAKYLGSATVAADNTDYATIALNKADGAGGALTVMASSDTRAANMNGIALGVTKDLTLSTVAGALDLTAGQVLAFSIAKAGSGKVVPISEIVVTVELS